MSVCVHIAMCMCLGTLFVLSISRLLPKCPPLTTQWQSSCVHEGELGGRGDGRRGEGMDACVE